MAGSRRRLELRRPALGVELDELEGILERQVRPLARHPPRSTEHGVRLRCGMDVRVSHRGHERMFPRPPSVRVHGRPQ